MAAGSALTWLARLVSDDTITRYYPASTVFVSKLDLFDIEDQVLRLIPQEVAQKYSVLHSRA